jgi:hypothetical protein
MPAIVPPVRSTVAPIASSALYELIEDSSTMTHAPGLMTGRLPNMARANV